MSRRSILIIIGRKVDVTVTDTYMSVIVIEGVPGQVTVIVERIPVVLVYACGCGWRCGSKLLVPYYYLAFGTLRGYLC